MHYLPWQYSVSAQPNAIEHFLFHGQLASQAKRDARYESDIHFPGPGDAAIPGNQVTYPVFSPIATARLYTPPITLHTAGKILPATPSPLAPRGFYNPAAISVTAGGNARVTVQAIGGRRYAILQKDDGSWHKPEKRPTTRYRYASMNTAMSGHLPAA